MSNTKLIIIAVVVIAISVFASYLLIPGKTVVEQITETQQVAGGGADFSTNWYRFGGVEHSAGAMTMKTATSTICRIQGPSATSTLIFAAVDFKTGTTTASIVDIAKSTNALSYATTTKIGSTYAMAANIMGTIIASTTPTLGATTFNPNDWLVVKMVSDTTASADLLAPTGFCKAEWIVTGR